MILFLRSSASRVNEKEYICNFRPLIWLFWELLKLFFFSKNPLARCYFYTQKPRRWKRLEKMRGVSSLGFSHSFSFITTVRLLHRRSHPTVVHSQLRECQSLEEQYQKKAKKYWDSFYKRHQNKVSLFTFIFSPLFWRQKRQVDRIFEWCLLVGL